MTTVNHLKRRSPVISTVARIYDVVTVAEFARSLIVSPNTVGSVNTLDVRSADHFRAEKTCALSHGKSVTITRLAGSQRRQPLRPGGHISLRPGVTNSICPTAVRSHIRLAAPAVDRMLRQLVGLRHRPGRTYATAALVCPADPYITAGQVTATRPPAANGCHGGHYGCGIVRPLGTRHPTSPTSSGVLVWASRASW